jgi:16S rRNA (guanine527-N7)-methyltransferase
VSRRPSTPFDELMAGLEAITRHPPDSTTRQAFEQYLELFLRWNRTHRMTALSPTGVVRDLLLDSLLFLPLLPPRPLHVADLGAGAGIPGLPLRLAAADISVTLVESRRKRVSFLRAVQRELGLGNVAVREGRAEELVDRDPELAGRFDAVVARAVGEPGSLREVALKYLKIGGVFLVSGPPRPKGLSGFETVRVRTRGGSTTRTFFKAIKEA